LNNSWRTIEPKTYLINEKAFKNFIQESGLINIIPEETYITDTSAQFIVSKRLILSRPKDFYENLYKHIKVNDDAVAVEMVWCFIFGGVYPPKEDYFYPPIGQTCWS
jgi:hypothetical protein